MPAASQRPEHRRRETPDQARPKHSHPRRHGSSTNQVPQSQGPLSDRPQPPERSDTVHSRYVQMLLKQENIPKMHNILAAASVWLMLAGFLVFPGTFKSLPDDDDVDSATAQHILDGVRNIPLLVIGAIACGIATLGMCGLALRHIRNYVWLLNKLFLPGVANGIAGLISTLIGVYSSQDGSWSITAKVTAIIEGCYVGVCLFLFLLFNYYFLRKVRETHGAYYEGRTSGEGLKEKFGRKAKEPGMEPGSLV